jgi:hypothetical protein
MPKRIDFAKQRRDQGRSLSSAVRELTAMMEPVARQHGINLRAILNEASVRKSEEERLLAERLQESVVPLFINRTGQEYRVDYLPAELNTGMFGGNSNWRGPIWMPVNVLIIRALLNFYLYYGDNFKIECPTGSGKLMNLFEVSKEISNRLIRIFLPNEQGRRPFYGGTEKFQSDPHWRDHILFYEYFHGDNGAGLGASHQTGWTGLVAKLIELYGVLDPKRALEVGNQAAFIAKARSAG